MNNLLSAYPLKNLRDLTGNIIRPFFHVEPIVADPDTGIMHMPEGFARILFHAKTRSMHLMFATSVEDLALNEQGELYPDRFARCAHVASYRVGVNKGGDGAFDVGALVYKEAFENRFFTDLRAFRETIRTRASRHYTLYTARIDNLDPALKAKGIVTDTETEFSTNGRLAYVLDKTNDEKYRLKFYAPTHRKEGSFAPFNLNERGLMARFNKVSHVIGEFDDYEQAIQSREDHWIKMGRIIREEQNLFSGHGHRFQLKAAFNLAVNSLYDHAPRIGLAVGIGGAVGHTVGALFGGASWLSAYIGSAANSASDWFTNGAYEEGRKRLADSRHKPRITSYGNGENATNFFRIQKREQIGREYSPVDAERFPASEFTAVAFDDFNLVNNSARQALRSPVVDVRERLVSKHMRDDISQCNFLDEHTVLHRFENGVTRIICRNSDEKIMHVFAYYDEKKSKKPLDEAIKAQFQGGLITFTYDERHQYYGEPHFYEHAENALQDISALIGAQSKNTYISVTPWDEALRSNLTQGAKPVAPSTAHLPRCALDEVA